MYFLVWLLPISAWCVFNVHIFVLVGLQRSVRGGPGPEPGVRREAGRDRGAARGRGRLSAHNTRGSLGGGVHNGNWPGAQQDAFRKDIDFTRVFVAVYTTPRLNFS